MRVLGMMAGTSLDGVDAALCEIEGMAPHDLRARLLAFECQPYPSELRERLRAASEDLCPVSEVARLHVEVSRAFADAALHVFERHGNADLIGAHGQTVCHLPEVGVSLQIGSAPHLAAWTGVPVIADLRAADLAWGGAGAPLTPFADWVTLRHARRTRVTQNIGGIANCALIPAGAGLEAVRAWDTGPGNMLLDEAARHFFDLPFDRDGSLAARGQADEVWVEEMLATHPFFARRAPKSCGREEFGIAFFTRWRKRLGEGCDALASLCLLTARSIARSVVPEVISAQASEAANDWEMIVGGGGAFNAHLLATLRAEVSALAPAAHVTTHEERGDRSDAREALSWAILCHQSWHGHATNLPAVTGAARAIPLGVLALPAPRPQAETPPSQNAAI